CALPICYKSISSVGYCLPVKIGYSGRFTPIHAVSRYHGTSRAEVTYCHKSTTSVCDRKPTILLCVTVRRPRNSVRGGHYSVGSVASHRDEQTVTVSNRVPLILFSRHM